MGIFDRIARLFRSNVNELISRAEEPEKMLNQIIADMRTQMVRAKQQVAAAIADEKRLQEQTVQELRQAEDWERRAMLAVRENRDDLAKQALVRRSEHVARGSQMQITWEAHKQETDRLKNQLRELNDNIEEASRKKNLLIAKQRRAQAQERIAETMSRISDKSAFEAFARMEEKISANELRVRASVEIDEEFSGDALGREFSRLESGSASESAEIQLLDLKQKMGILSSGTPGTGRRLGAGETQDAEVIESSSEEKTGP
ncbi:MAG TPA: PspA/IM30 family protein [Gemmatimonadaceae bacterium]